jgi:hypothetical protein
VTITPVDVEAAWGLVVGTDYRVRLRGDPERTTYGTYVATRVVEGTADAVLWFEVEEPVEPVGGLPRSWVHPWRVAAGAVAEIAPLTKP